MTKTVLFDIDGTLADLTHRLHHITAKPPNWDAFFAECGNDQVIEPIRELAQMVAAQGYRILLVSGRTDKVRQQTEAWLGRTTWFASVRRSRYTGHGKSKPEEQRNLRKGLRMADQGQGSPTIAGVAVYLEGVAKYLMGKLHGAAGPAWETSLTQLEDLILALQQTLAEHCFTLALTQHAQQLASGPEDRRQCPTCGQPLSCTDLQNRSTNTRAGLARWAEPFAHCDHCRRDFFPQSRALGIDQSSLSPGFLRKVIATATRCRSFLDADDLLRELSGLDLGPKQIERLVHKIGQERVDERDEAVERFKQLPLAEKFAVPQGVTAPEVAVVMTDGGRYQMRFPSRSADANPVGTVDAPASGAGRARTRRPPQLRKPPRTRRKKRRKRRTGVRIRSACC